MPTRFHLTNHVLNSGKWISKLPAIHRQRVQDIGEGFKARVNLKKTFLEQDKVKILFPDESKKAARLEPQYHTQLAKHFLWKLETAEDVSEYIAEINEFAFKQISNNDFLKIINGLNNAPEKRDAIRRALAKRGR